MEGQDSLLVIDTQPYIMETLGTKESDSHVAERIAARTVALPFFASLSEEQVSRIVAILRDRLKTSASGPSSIFESERY